MQFLSRNSSVLPINKTTNNNECSNKTTALKHLTQMKRQLLSLGDQNYEQWMCNLTQCSATAPIVVFIFLWMSFNGISFISCRCFATSTTFFRCMWLCTMSIIILCHIGIQTKMPLSQNLGRPYNWLMGLGLGGKVLFFPTYRLVYQSKGFDPWGMTWQCFFSKAFRMYVCISSSLLTFIYIWTYHNTL